MHNAVSSYAGITCYVDTIVIECSHTDKHVWFSRIVVVCSFLLYCLFTPLYFVLYTQVTVVPAGLLCPIFLGVLFSMCLMI